jgi:hypothetical protein
LWNGCRIDASDKLFIDKKYILDLDEFGFPVVTLANRLLVRQADFGESREALEKKWQQWLHYHPFDAPVAGRLAEIYSQHLSRLDPQSDKGTIQRLARKLRLTEARARRYDPAAFDR